MVILHMSVHMVRLIKMKLTNYIILPYQNIQPLARGSAIIKWFALVRQLSVRKAPGPNFAA